MDVVGGSEWAVGLPPTAGDPADLLVFPCVLGRDFCALIESEGAAERVWAAASTGSCAVEELVSAVQSEAGSFVVLVITAPGSILVVARGSFEVEVDRGTTTRLFDGVDVHPWHLATFEGVVGFTVNPISARRGTMAPAAAEHIRVDSVPRTGRAAWIGTISQPRVETLQTDPVVSASESVVAAAARCSVPSYRYRVGGGKPSSLAVPVVLGRRPALPRGADSERISLLCVPSPTRTVSATHLRIAQRGPTVVATDLRLTNGTTVHAPGFPVRRLRQGESVVVVPGTRIDIGDGNIVEILPVQAASSPGNRL